MRGATDRAGQSRLARRYGAGCARLHHRCRRQLQLGAEHAGVPCALHPVGHLQRRLRRTRRSRATTVTLPTSVNDNTIPRSLLPRHGVHPPARFRRAEGGGVRGRQQPVRSRSAGHAIGAIWAPTRCCSIRWAARSRSACGCVSAADRGRRGGAGFGPSAPAADVVDTIPARDRAVDAPSPVLETGLSRAPGGVRGAAMLFRGGRRGARTVTR